MFKSHMNLNMLNIITIITYFFAIIGLIGTIRKAIYSWNSIKKITWPQLERYVSRIIKQIEKDNYKPDYILGVGRSGVILSALISGNAKHRIGKSNIPIIGCDRYFKWVNNIRIDHDNALDFNMLTGKRVLLTLGDVSSGGTLKFFKNKIKEYKVRELRTAVIVKSSCNS